MYIEGTDRGETLAGTGRGDFIFAYGGNDVVHAKNGYDVVDAGPGSDRILGGRGADTLYGGAGADRFVFDDRDASLHASDLIADFGAADVIDLTAVDVREFGGRTDTPEAGQ